MKNCLLSIIVPVYNVEKYLENCINSLINQTLHNIEIILVDDGSTDNSGLICDQYQLIDKRIKVIHKQNRGISDTRNIGIKNATGRYIGFVDSDDCVKKTMFETLYNIALENDADIVQCDFTRIYENQKNNICKQLDIQKINEYKGEDVLYKLDGKEGEKIVVVWNKIYKKELFDGIKFPLNKINEDEFITYKLIHKSRKLIDVDMKMYYYRQREDSIMSKEFSIERLDVIEALEERREYFKLNKLNVLAKKTDATISTYLKGFYTEVSNSQIKDKKIILKRIKRYMYKYYIKFLVNTEITFRGKVSLTLCILNGKLFAKLY